MFINEKAEYTIGNRTGTYNIRRYVPCDKKMY
jgi:hypothetical protein